MNDLANTDIKQNTPLIGDVWTRRFRTEGQMWGNEASPPARFLTRRVLDHSSNIVEIGAGYGRDTNWFAENGHNVTAIERSHEALVIASNELKQKIDNGAVSFITSDFRKASLGNKSHDVFFSHRVLHLLGHNGVTESFARVASNVLKPEGKLLVTARSLQDFNDKQMVWEDQGSGIAKYRDDLPDLGDRRGQVLYLWSEEKLKNLFEASFENMAFKEDEEVELPLCSQGRSR